MRAGDPAMRGAGGGSGRIDRRRIASWQAAAVIAVATVLGIGVPAGEAKGQTTKVIFAFNTTAPLGFGPVAGLVADGQGNFYGTTTQGGAHGVGVVYELSPPAAGMHKWRAKVIFVLHGGKQGCSTSPLTIDPDGNLYGTTPDGGQAGCSGYGTVFKLSPPASGTKSWSLTTLYTFQHTPGAYFFDGFRPWRARLYRDAAGNLYGTTVAGGVVVKQESDGEYVASTCGLGGSGCGTVFELSPPAAGATTWTETILHNFVSDTFSDPDFGAIFDGSDPRSGLVMDASGNLYGTTFDNYVDSAGDSYDGMVFELSPPSNGTPGWTETILHGFAGGVDSGAPVGSLTIDAHGNVFGTTSGVSINCGGVFELGVPPSGGTASVEAPIYTFSGSNGCQPQEGVAVDATGNVYGTTAAGGSPRLDQGTVFELSPPALDTTNWTELVLHTFGGSGVLDLTYPTSQLLIDSSGKLLGTASGYEAGLGGVFEVTPPLSGAAAN